MELREIAVEDIYPDEKNPRKDFGDIAALADSCMLNAINPGEPVNPIVVIADGGIYRIVDGERRYKAIKKNKLTHCHAIVCEGMDEANTMLAMIATDDKQQLTEIERSQGVQQMLILGVDPATVDRAGRLRKGNAARIKRAQSVTHGNSDNMSLDWMLAIAEFVDAGNDQAVKRLTECSPDAWQVVANGERRLAGINKQRDELIQACKDAGVTVSEERLLDDLDWEWWGDAGDPESVAVAADDAPDGSVVWVGNGGGSQCTAEFYMPANAAGETEAEDELSERIGLTKEIIKAAREQHLIWFASQLDAVDNIPHIMDIVTDTILYGRVGFYHEAHQFEDTADVYLGRTFCPTLIAVGYIRAAQANECREWHADVLLMDYPSYYLDDLNCFVAWYDALQADGYSLTNADHEIMRLITEAQERAQKIIDDNPKDGE